MLLKSLKYLVNSVKFARNMSENLFTQSLNPITGKNEWVTQCDDYDYQQEVARAGKFFRFKSRTFFEIFFLQLSLICFMTVRGTRSIMQL